VKVLLIRPKPDKETIGLQHVMICEPLELEYLASNVPDQIITDVDLIIYDLIVEKKPFKVILEWEKPDLVVFTGYITHVETIKNLAKIAKSLYPKVLTGVGGVHAEVVGDDFLDAHIDFIYRKNGVDGFNATLLGILNGLDKQKLKEDILEIERKDFRFELKHPNRGATDKYRSKYYYMFHNPCALIKTSYGCPFQCSFCFCKMITQGKYFVRSMEDVISEIADINEKEIYIVDDDFLFNKNRLKTFVRMLKERNINKNYLVYGRADFIADNEEVMRELKTVGLRAVIVGIESIRTKDLKSYNKKTTVERNVKCIQTLKSLDIELYATLILPMDFTKKDFKELTRWLVDLEVTFVNLQPLTPIPGTEIFDDYKERLIIPREQYEKFDMAHVIVEPSCLSIRQFYMQMLMSYHAIIMRPKNMVRLLKKYGLKENIKMMRGSQRICFQYLRKIIRG
jgi:radical SAM superfamily enzyme YgiQ (UPF0313 family)